MKLTVYLAEKPKMGKIIASALASIDGTSTPPITNNKIEGNGWAVCWLAGHAYELFDAKEYKDEWNQTWSKLPLPLIPESFLFKPIKGDFIEGCRNAASGLINKASTVVIATDAGQEGQVIAEIFLSQNKWSGKTLRLWSSAANNAEMVKALGSLKSNDDMKFQGHKNSGLARMYNDWMIGINFTVAYTNMARKAGYDIVASAGRVQSACLAICVDHDEMVERFKSASYYEVEAVLETESGEQFCSKLIIPEHLKQDGKHCVDEGALQQIINECRDKEAAITGISESRQTSSPPTPYNLTTLAIALNREFNITSGELMKLYQAMYEAGWLTYTRTDDTYYEDDQLKNIDKVFNMLKEVEPEFIPLVDKADISLKPASFNSSKIEEHSANSPTASKPKWDSLDQKSKDIYRTVAKQMICQFYPDYINAITHVVIKIGSYPFEVKGNTVVQTGWTDVKKPNSEEEITHLPTLNKGDQVSVISIETLAKKTRAPARMTEAKLLEIMKNASAYLASEQTKKRLGENATLGTAATRAAVIDLLIDKRKYLSRYPNGVFRPTKTGKKVRALLPPELSTPDLSALWEINFKAIRKGTITPEVFVAKTKNWVANQVHMASQRTIKPNPLSFPCSQCQNPMTRRTSRTNKQAFWACSSDDCNHFTPDHGGKPVEPLPNDGNPCKECGEPLKTLVRNTQRMSLEQRRKNKDLRYLKCINNHFNSN